MDMQSFEVNVACMATAIYAEANTQSLDAKYGVGYVILNRLKSKRYGADICEVVYNKGQFEGVRDIATGKHIGPTKCDLLKTELIAINIITHKAINPVSNALYFHDDSIKSMSHAWGKKTTKIDNLIFY
jgi:spore germination cell wall hydrolase CwlJ-like protein